MLSDPGFESSTPNGTFPDSGYWKPASAGGGAYAVCTTTAARSGSNGLWAYTGNETWAWWSRPYQQFSASPGEVYTGRAWIRSPPPGPGVSWVNGSLASVRIEFLNSNLQVIASKNSPGSQQQILVWAQYSVTSDPAPLGTTYVRFICNIEKPNGTSGISVANFDDTFFEIIPLVSYTLSSSTITLTSAGATQQLTVTGSYSDGYTKNLTSQSTFSSSNTSVATVNASGLVTAVANGSTTITASSGGKTATVTVTVNITVPGTTTVPQTTTTTTISLSNHEESAYQYLYNVMDKYHSSFYVYTDQDAGGNHGFPSGWMGDISALQLNTGWTENCHSGNTCIKNVWTPREATWAGIMWQEPENNWGKIKDGGYDLPGATELSFWARGEEGGEPVDFIVGGITGDYPDSIQPTIHTGVIRLTKEWKKYTIDLRGKDLRNVIGLFGWITSIDPVFYLDDIRYNKSRPNDLRFLVSYEALASIDPDRYIRNASFIYDNALALLAFLARGTEDDLRRARILADAFVYAQNNDRYYTDGRLRNAYMSGDLADNQTGKARLPGWWDPEKKQWFEDRFQVSSYTGNMAWVMIALLQYYQAKGGDKYLEAARRLGDWIYTHTYDTRGHGGYTGGYDGWESSAEDPDGPKKITWKSTEHNIDCYAAFMKLYKVTDNSVWQERAQHARRFMEGKIAKTKSKTSIPNPLLKPLQIPAFYPEGSPYLVGPEHIFFNPPVDSPPGYVEVPSYFVNTVVLLYGKTTSFHCTLFLWARPIAIASKNLGWLPFPRKLHPPRLYQLCIYHIG